MTRRQTDCERAVAQVGLVCLAEPASGGNCYIQKAEDPESAEGTSVDDAAITMHDSKFSGLCYALHASRDIAVGDVLSIGGAPTQKTNAQKLQPILPPAEAEAALQIKEYNDAAAELTSVPAPRKRVDAEARRKATAKVDAEKAADKAAAKLAEKVAAKAAKKAAGAAAAGAHGDKAGGGSKEDSEDSDLELDSHADDVYTGMAAAYVRKMCADAKLKTDGSKPELIERLTY